MREIKFRCWDIKLGNYADLIWGVFDNSEDQSCQSGPPSPHGRFIHEQFTGLKDSDENEIYEGDIVEFTYWWFDGRGESETTLKGEVVYLPECLSFGLKGVKNKLWCKHVGCDPEVGDTCAFAFWRFEESDFHVIGNIHQNPELLK